MSAYRFTLADAKANIRIRNVAGACSDTAEFAAQINTVTETLLNRGAWWGTEVLVRFCVNSCDIVWPHYVGTVSGLRGCNGQIEVKNNWYAILGPACAFNAAGNAAGYGAYSGIGFGGWTQPTAFDRDTTPVHTQITGNNGKFLRYYVTKPQDYGKTIRIFGTKYGGQPLQEQDSNGDWVMGITLTAAQPYAQSTALVTRIDQITREATQGMTYLYQYDPAMAGTGQYQLGVYEPGETNPQYRRSRLRLNGIPYATDANEVKTWSVEALVKLAFIPVVGDRDFLLIDNWAALAYGIQALKLDEANDPSTAEAYWAKAIRELNFESRDKNPAQNFVVKARFMGSQTVVSNPI